MYRRGGAKNVPRARRQLVGVVHGKVLDLVDRDHDGGFVRPCSLAGSNEQIGKIA